MTTPTPHRRSSVLRDRIESGFERWGRFASRNAGRIVAAALALTAAFAVWIPTLEVDNSQEAFLHHDDPVRIAYDAFRTEFGRDERILVAIRTDDVFSVEFLEKLRSFHEDLEREVPNLHEVSSLVNARDTRGEGDTLVVGELMEEMPRTPEDVALLRERVLANPLLRGSLVTVDGTVAVVFMRLVAFADDEDADVLAAGFEETDAADGSEPVYLPEPEIARAVDAVRDVIDRYEGDGFEAMIAGTPVMSETLNHRMMIDMGVFTLVSLVAIAVFLFALFRRLAAVVLPMLVVGLSMVATLGVMAASGTTIGVATQILPPFLLCVGVCDAVHLLAIFYQRLASGARREDAIAYSLGHSGLAIVMTSLTTMGGLGSFIVADMKPISDLGTFAPIGVLFALVYTVALMPALLALIPTPPPRPAGAAAGRARRFVVGLGDFSARHPWSVVAVALALIAASGSGIAFLRFGHDPIEWLPDDDEFRIATKFMDRRLDGVNSVEVVVDTGAENGVYEPALLNRIDEFRRRNDRTFEGKWHIAKTLSLNDVLRETHRALNENREEFYAIPQDRELVAQELVLFENSGSDDLEDFVDPLFRKARITLRVPWMDAVEFPTKLAEMEQQLAVLFPDEEIEITGLVPVMSKTFLSVFRSMTRSYAIAIVVILPLMVLLIGRLSLGLLSMIPNVAPVIVALGFMGWAELPVDGLTMMVGAIVIGLAVDDTIHFMHNFRRYYERTGDARQAIHETLESTGQALLITSLVLAAGFFAYLGAYMSNVRLFGFLCGGAILLAFFSNVILASSLMVLAARRRA